MVAMPLTWSPSTNCYSFHNKCHTSVHCSIERAPNESSNLLVVSIASFLNRKVAIYAFAIPLIYFEFDSIEICIQKSRTIRTVRAIWYDFNWFIHTSEEWRHNVVGKHCLPSYSSFGKITFLHSRAAKHMNISRLCFII